MNYPIRSSAALMFLLMWTVPSFAQQVQTGGGTTTGQTATGGTNTGTGTATDTAAIGMLDADTAFAAVERGDTIGSTASTGTGFSDLSAGAGAGGRGAGGLGGFGGGGLGGLGALGNLFGNFNTGGGQATQPPIRTRLRSAINVQVTPPARVQQVATQRFRYLSTRPQLRGINVNMQGKTAVISGMVSSDRDRRMSELLMRLEPGVQSVDNRVVVMPQ